MVEGEGIIQLIDLFRFWQSEEGAAGTEDSLTSTEFDRFLAERAAAADNLPTISKEEKNGLLGGEVNSSSGGEVEMEEEKKEKEKEEMKVPEIPQRSAIESGGSERPRPMRKAEEPLIEF